MVAVGIPHLLTSTLSLIRQVSRLCKLLFSSQPVRAAQEPPGQDLAHRCCLLLLVHCRYPSVIKEDAKAVPRPACGVHTPFHGSTLAPRPAQIPLFSPLLLLVSEAATASVGMWDALCPCQS